MQKALNDKMSETEDKKQLDNDSSPDKIAVFFQYLPSFEEFKNNGFECENNFKGCKLF